MMRLDGAGFDTKIVGLGGYFQTLIQEAKKATNSIPAKIQ
jgi:hypothetical protein